MAGEDARLRQRYQREKDLKVEEGACLPLFANEMVIHEHDISPRSISRCNEGIRHLQCFCKSR